MWVHHRNAAGWENTRDWPVRYYTGYNPESYPLQFHQLRAVSLRFRHYPNSSSFRDKRIRSCFFGGTGMVIDAEAWFRDPLRVPDEDILGYWHPATYNNASDLSSGTKVAIQFIQEQMYCKGIDSHRMLFISRPWKFYRFYFFNG